MGECYEENKGYLSEDYEHYCRYRCRPCRSLCRTVGVFFHAVSDSDHFASDHHGAVYASDEGRCDDSRDPGVSGVGRESDHVHCEPGL